MKCSFPKSKKRRILKKWFKRTLILKPRFVKKENGLYLYKVTLP
jgi:hypothetical protein